MYGVECLLNLARKLACLPVELFQKGADCISCSCIIPLCPPPPLSSCPLAWQLIIGYTLWRFFLASMIVHTHCLFLGHCISEYVYNLLTVIFFLSRRMMLHTVSDMYLKLTNSDKVSLSNTLEHVLRKKTPACRCTCLNSITAFAQSANSLTGTRLTQKIWTSSSLLEPL